MPATVHADARDATIFEARLNEARAEAAGRLTETAIRLACARRWPSLCAAWNRHLNREAGRAMAVPS